MNKIHRVLWSRTRGQFVAVAEIAKSCGQGSSLSDGRVSALTKAINVGLPEHEDITEALACSAYRIPALPVDRDLGPLDGQCPDRVGGCPGRSLFAQHTAWPTGLLTGPHRRAVAMFIGHHCGQVFGFNAVKALQIALAAFQFLTTVVQPLRQLKL
jgi:hypothetical protein